MDSYKVVLVGDGGVGKTTFLKRLLTNKFEGKYVPTLGTEVEPVRIPHACLNVWDCAGQERFRGLREGYYSNAQAAIFAFDLSSRHTYIVMLSYMENVFRLNGRIPCMIVGLKSDLEHVVTTKEIATKFPDISYVEVSAKSERGVKEILPRLLEEIKARI